MTTSAPTFKVQLVNMTNGSVTGHKAGCSDLKKLAQRHDVLPVEETTSKLRTYLEYNADFIAENSGAHDIDWKACANHVPDVTPDDESASAGSTKDELDDVADAVEKAQKPLTRNECIAQLRDAGYDGPVSYFVPRLREMLAFVKDGVDLKDAHFTTQAR